MILTWFNNFLSWHYCPPTSALLRGKITLVTLYQRLSFLMGNEPSLWSSASLKLFCFITWLITVHSYQCRNKFCWVSIFWSGYSNILKLSSLCKGSSPFWWCRHCDSQYMITKTELMFIRLMFILLWCGGHHHEGWWTNNAGRKFRQSWFKFKLN